MTRLIHTADWQLGKPYGRVDSDVRAALTEARFDALGSRLDLLTEFLTEAATRVQVILLTCRDRAFRHLGNRITLTRTQ